MAQQDRLYFLDWLRVLAILVLHFWHTGMIYTAEWTWHIKNEETSHAMLEVMYFFAQWRMALLFFVSGTGTRFALGKRTGGQYLHERVLRLAVPVLFATFIIVPPQIFFERLQDGMKFNYFEFYQTVLQFRFWPKGNFHWLHMWFVVYLFLYSLLALPLFLWLRSEKRKPFFDKLFVFSQKTAFLPFLLLLAIPYALLYNHFPQRYNVVQDPTYFLFYFTFFIAGYLFQSEPRFWDLLEKRRRVWLQVACLCYVVITAMRWNHWHPYYGVDSWPNALWDSLRAANSWFWVMAALGYARHFLNRPARWLNYANEGIYPFYILHQTMIVMVGYYVTQPVDDLLVKYLFNLVVAFLLAMGIYEFLVRPYPVMRFLFGMKGPAGAKKEPPAL